MIISIVDSSRLPFQPYKICCVMAGTRCSSPGKVILASDLCCRSSFSSLLNRKTLKALCSKPGQVLGRQVRSELLQQWERTAGRAYLCRCWRWGGSFSWCPLRSSGRSRRWGCTSLRAAGPASRPGGPWWSRASWLQPVRVSLRWCRNGTTLILYHLHNMVFVDFRQRISTLSIHLNQFIQ